MKTVRIPDEIHKRLEERKTHDNQPFYEVIGELLEEAEPEGREELFAKAASFLARRGAVKVAVFGSRVKGKADLESDLDILVKFPESVKMSLLDRSRLQAELSEILGIDVDIVEEEELRSYIADEVKEEAEVIHERR